MDLALRVVKQDKVQMSIDFVSTQDIEYMQWIFETLTFLTDCEIYSD